MEKNLISLENNANEGSKPVKTDSAEIVKRHLQDKNHEITDEDIRNVKIVTADDEPITVGAEAAARFADDDLLEKSDSETEEEDVDPNAKPGTPWSVLGE